MLIQEILCENTSDNVDLQNIARYITSYIRYIQLQGKYKFRFKVSAAFNKTTDVPNIRNLKLKEALSKLTILVRPGKNNLDGFFNITDNAIVVYIGNMKYEWKLQYLLVHELQHAWDYARSQGINWSDVDPNTYEYTKSEEEINARFAEALMNLSDLDLSTNEKIIDRINRVFRYATIFRELYDEEPNGRQKYNRLLTRAYKFCKEVGNYEKFNHEKLPRETVQQMIKKTLRELK